MVLLKTAPMMDIAQGIEELGCVAAIHILEWRGDCREVLYILKSGSDLAAEDIPVSAVTLEDDGSVSKQLTFTKAQEKAAEVALSEPLHYLYEPGPAFQKSGAYHLMAQHFGVKKLHPHTHLYTSDTFIPDFPGRAFHENTTGAHAKNLPLNKANLTLRNFPGRIETLRKRLKLKEGGEDYIFACTLHNDEKALILCKKAYK